MGSDGCFGPGCFGLDGGALTVSRDLFLGFECAHG